jgi:hypothetical protein
MKTYDVSFTKGTYDRPCPNIKDVMIGAVACTGHEGVGYKKCTYCVSFKQDNFYDAEILKEKIPIVSEVVCSFLTPKETQLTLF